MFPRLVSSGKDGPRGISDTGLAAVTIEAIKEQHEAIKSLTQQVKELKELLAKVL